MGVGVAARGWARWGLFALIMALPALAVVWLAVVVVRFATSDHPLGGGPEKVPCAEALDFGGAKLPKGAYDTECTVRAWMDTDYSASFRMPRASVRDWLKGTYPKGPAPGTEYCDEGADLCLNLDSEEHRPPAGADADAVVVNVTYEGPDTARVIFSAFTV